MTPNKLARFVETHSAEGPDQHPGESYGQLEKHFPAILGLFGPEAVRVWDLARGVGTETHRSTWGGTEAA